MSSHEFYPERALCFTLPEFVRGFTKIVIADCYANEQFYDVPTKLILRADTGSSHVACRVLHELIDFCHVEIPTMLDSATLVIPSISLVPPSQ